MSSPAEIRTKIEAYIQELGLSFESVAGSLWVVHDTRRGLEHLVVLADDDLVVVRVKVMELPEGERESFLEELLRLNLTMYHGAYALEEESVIWMDTLEFPSMDIEEFRATLDAAAMHLNDHASRLARYRSGGTDEIL